SIVKWPEEISVHNRVAWISCYGVPLQSWNVQTFINIAERYGEFIGVDSATRHFNSFVRGNVQIITDGSSKIDEIIRLKSGNAFHDKGQTICMGDDSNSDDFLSSKSDSSVEDCLEKRGVEQPRLENAPIENGDRL
ncbi:hypothetical protein Gotri_021896, partial [Gossypium trilobum]|nr:hypothetical protein [Gossypium trilobum]